MGPLSCFRVNTRVSQLDLQPGVTVRLLLEFRLQLSAIFFVVLLSLFHFSLLPFPHKSALMFL